MDSESQQRHWYASPANVLMASLLAVTGLISLFGLVIATDVGGGPTPELMSNAQLASVHNALHKYVKEYGQYPSDIINSEGQPVLSWRVELLPFLGLEDYKNEFDLQQPWDADRNKRLSHGFFEYKSSRLESEEAVAHYLAPDGEFLSDGLHTVLSNGQFCRPEEITDDPASTILLIEVATDQGVNWTQPKDFQVDPLNPKAGLDFEGDGVMVCLVNGKTRRLPAEITDEELLGLFTINGGEPVPEGWK